MMILRVREWSRLASPAPCEVCGGLTWAETSRGPLHMQCSSHVLSSPANLMFLTDAQARELRQQGVHIWRAQVLPRPWDNPHHAGGMSWSPWGCARDLPNRHDRRRTGLGSDGGDHHPLRFQMRAIKARAVSRGRVISA
jgi:hypothetical protein